MMSTRDFNRELSDDVGRKYAYGFDFDVMHHYMIKSCLPYMRAGAALELGSFKGDFTLRLLPFFSEITCVEASGDAAAEAKRRVPGVVRILEGTFEGIELNQRFDNVFLTHVLEHVEDPVHVLRRVNDEWLTDQGRLFLICPNANAASRQIAVRMGIVSHHAAITEAERRHGHHRTYSLDTLERDATAAGLRVEHRPACSSKRLQTSSGMRSSRQVSCRKTT